MPIFATNFHHHSIPSNFNHHFVPNQFPPQWIFPTITPNPQPTLPHPESILTIIYSIYGRINSIQSNESWILQLTNQLTNQSTIQLINWQTPINHRHDTNWPPQWPDQHTTIVTTSHTTANTLTIANTNHNKTQTIAKTHHKPTTISTQQPNHYYKHPPQQCVSTTRTTTTISKDTTQHLQTQHIY